MIVIAGAPGSGKSTIFPVSSFGVAGFNADDRASQLNGGFYTGISRDIRSVVNREFESFVESHIASGKSFAIETTLRSTVTFEQAARAKAAGFLTEMRYLVLRDFAMHLDRVKTRSDAGGHSASARILQSIYAASLANLRGALTCMDDLWIYDNSQPGGPPRLLMKSHQGTKRFVASNLPDWLHRVLEDS